MKTLMKQFAKDLLFLLREMPNTAFSVSLVLMFAILVFGWKALALVPIWYACFRFGARE